MSKRALSWKARRVGDKFCSTACGRGCTLAEYLQASTLADKIALRLGKGWNPHAWENLGWHGKAISKCGRLKVHPNVWNGKPRGFTAYLGDSDSPGGTWVESGTTPEEAVRKVIATAKKFIAKINACIAGL